MSNPFFKNHGPLKVSDIIKSLNLTISGIDNHSEIYDIKDLVSSNEKDITRSLIS